MCCALVVADLTAHLLIHYAAVPQQTVCKMYVIVNAYPCASSVLQVTIMEEDAPQLTRDLLEYVSCLTTYQTCFTCAARSRSGRHVMHLGRFCFVAQNSENNACHHNSPAAHLHLHPQRVRRSLARLGVSSLDLVQLHWENLDQQQGQEVGIKLCKPHKVSLGSIW